MSVSGPCRSVLFLGFIVLPAAGSAAPALADGYGPAPVLAESAGPAPTSDQSTSAQVAAGRLPPPPPLTFHGITLYGTVDVGVAYLSHGAPLSATYGPGLPFTIQKFSNRSTYSLAENGLSQSKIGVAIDEPLGKDFSVVGRLETGFQPLSLRLTDGPASLIKNNGKPLSQQTESGDTSRAGQFAQGQAYFGVHSKTFGTLTYGRQNSLILDDLYKYDPQAQSKAFSAIGYSGTAGGGGDTEDTILDDTIKYAVGYGPARLSLMHQFRSGGAIPGGADEIDLGADLHGLSVDAAYSQVHDAISDASLSAAQNALNPGTLAATVSDNTTWSVMAKYKRGPIRLYGGWEHIQYANPSDPVPAGATGLGGYVLSYVNNSAFTRHKTLQISWLGMRYVVTPRLEVTGAWYMYDQSSYAANGCSNASSSACGGTMNQVSLVADYRLTPRWDVYSGIGSSWVAGGLASGFLQTSMVSPMAGVRFNF